MKVKKLPAISTENKERGEEIKIMKRRDKITWDILIVLTRVTEGHDKRIGKEATFKMIEAENITKLFKNTNLPIHKCQSTPTKRNWRESSTRNL